MNDKQAHSNLKKIQEQSNGYKNSRRSKNEGHKLFAETLKDINLMKDKAKKGLL